MSDATTSVTHDLRDAGWKQIAGWLASADIEFAEISGPGWHVRMLRETGYLAQQGCEASPTGVRASRVTVTATVAGIFLDRHPLRPALLARPGARVRRGDVVGLLQLGAVLAPVITPVDGVMMDVLAPSGGLVGYGEALVHIDAGEAQWK